MNWLLVGSVGGGVTVVRVESGGMTYSAAHKLADEINAMYAAQHNAHPTVLAHSATAAHCPHCQGQIVIGLPETAQRVA